MAEKVIYAMYDDDDVLKDGAKKLVAKGVKVADVFSPFPIHGIDHAPANRDERENDHEFDDDDNIVKCGTFANSFVENHPYQKRDKRCGHIPNSADL